MGGQNRIRIKNPDPDPGRPKLPPKNEKKLEISCLNFEEPERLFYGRHIKIFVWIQIQIGPGSGLDPGSVNPDPKLPIENLDD